jgi:hypothetical protein
MARMTRTQITLEEDEYLFLKSQATERGISLSAVIRDLVRTRMSDGTDSSFHIWDLADLVPPTENGIVDFSGRDHDRIIADAIGAEFGLDECE